MKWYKGFSFPTPAIIHFLTQDPLIFICFTIFMTFFSLVFPKGHWPGWSRRLQTWRPEHHGVPPDRSRHPSRGGNQNGVAHHVPGGRQLSSERVHWDRGKLTMLIAPSRCTCSHRGQSVRWWNDGVSLLPLFLSPSLFLALLFCFSLSTCIFSAFRNCRWQFYDLLTEVILQ